ncbi:hypothetical protein C7S18_08605 [Ahniella affigens]|uniref:Uncharacterized protein n=1 Tax=Ahniella affigens TaxID=2021234 RepID=A0A2P1PQW9_9GAMM|nr:hypothetical protein [Ahniella affigens]AVP97250.1 hypothetical protein C7S18_08605 [Ahniella affigens]
MSIFKSTVLLSLLALSMFVHEADARSSRQSVGRVTHAHGDVVELRVFDGSPAVGALYDLRRRRAHNPKRVPLTPVAPVAQVRVTEVIDDNLVRAEVVEGSARRRDRAFPSAETP